ncbi:MAG: LmeA family phospholipid-binding protein [Thermovirgaceae bacterium]
MSAKGISFWLAFFFVIITVFSGPAFSAQASDDKFNAAEILFDAFVTGLKPESAEMILDGDPDENGRVRRIYLDLKGCVMDEVRIDRLKIDACEVIFTPPSTWDEEGPDVEEMLSVKAVARILEEDVNQALLVKQIGDDDEHWHDLSLDFRNGGIYARGYYLARFIFRLDILLEIDGHFDIRRGREIWLDDYTIRVNRVNVPDGLADRAVSRIQPIIDLGEFPFPLTLDRIIQEEDKITIRSRLDPESFEGRTFTYQREETL